MSEKKYQSNVLTYGFIRESYCHCIPIPLKRVIQLFYDKYIYYSLKFDTLNQCLIDSRDNDEQTLYLNKFTINLFQFQFVIKIPKQCNNILCNKLIEAGIIIKYWPPNVEYIEFYHEISCDQIPYSIIKRLNQMKSIFKPIICNPIAKFSDFKKLAVIHFDILVQIKYVQLKKNNDNNPYQMHINEIKNTLPRKVDYTWTIGEEMMRDIKKFICGQTLFSDNFGNNNWCLQLSPNGKYECWKGDVGIQLHAASLAFNGKMIRLMMTFFMDDTVIACIDGHYFGYKPTQTTIFGNLSIMKFDQLKTKTNISFRIIIEITQFVNANYCEIEHEEWNNIYIPWWNSFDVGKFYNRSPK